VAKLIERHVRPLAEEVVDTFPVTVVQGARRVGKSTLAGQICVARGGVQASLDNEEARNFALTDPRGFVRQNQGGLLAVDEVQRVPSLLLAVKEAVDLEPGPGRFLLTGSSDLLRLARTPDSLAGRAVTVNLSGLSQGELAGRRDDFAAWARSGPRRATAPPLAQEDYLNLLAVGGYPEAQRLSQRMRGLWLDSYVDRLLVRDVADVSRGLSADRLQRVLELVAANPAGELVQARLANSLGVPKSSIDAYLSALEIMYLTVDLPPWRPNLTKRQVGRHKVSVADTALAARLVKATPATLARPESATFRGGLFEAFLTGELLKQRAWTQTPFDLCHFRDADGLEVDLLLEYEDSRVLLVEVKSGQTYRSDSVKAINTLGEKLGDRFIGGVVLTMADECQQLAQNVWGLPASTLWSVS
jgi:predicted AAA+ superfamily ATPase